MNFDNFYIFLSSLIVQFCDILVTETGLGSDINLFFDMSNQCINNFEIAIVVALAYIIIRTSKLSFILKEQWLLVMFLNLDFVVYLSL